MLKILDMKSRLTTAFNFPDKHVLQAYKLIILPFLHCFRFKQTCKSRCSCHFLLPTILGGEGSILRYSQHQSCYRNSDL